MGIGSRYLLEYDKLSAVPECCETWIGRLVVSVERAMALAEALSEDQHDHVGMAVASGLHLWVMKVF